MVIKPLELQFSICKLKNFSDTDLNRKWFFTACTDEEFSLVCPTDAVPDSAIERDDGWKAFRIEGVLDFSLIGILSEISSLLADNKIGIFAVSTFNTDYIFTKQQSFEKALDLLSEKGYVISTKY